MPGDGVANADQPMRYVSVASTLGRVVGWPGRCPLLTGSESLSFLGGSTQLDDEAVSLGRGDAFLVSTQSV